MAKPTTIRLTDEDRQLIADLKKRYGIRDTAELIRLALRLLASHPALARPPAPTVANEEKQG